jgi:hypothetical protein
MDTEPLTQDKMILMMLTFLPPRRLEYKDLRVVFQKPINNNINYICFLKKEVRLYLRDYKGSDTKGE